MNQIEYNQDLFDFLSKSPSQFHAVQTMAAELKKNGFTRLKETDAWNLKPKGKYLITRNDSSLIALIMGRDDPAETGIRICGAHTDSPCLRVKPDPDLTEGNLTRLGVEVYGGTLMNSWFDRGLNLAGRLTCLSRNHDNNETLTSVLINFNRAVAVIPSLAIHLDREVNKQKSVNPQQQLPPLFSLGGGGSKPTFKENLLGQARAEHPDSGIREVLDFELYFSDALAPEFAGLNNDFILASRLDNLLSCHAGLRSILDVESDVESDTISDADPKFTSLLVCTDHEEVGSDSLAGARGSFVISCLERILKTPEALGRAAGRSFMISCDNAHGVHPAHREKHDENHLPQLNRGPVLKINAAQRYASDSESAAFFRILCRQAGVPLQQFVMRSDLVCGSTIGPSLSAKTGIKTVDVGAATLAMHSARELTGSKDPYLLYKVLHRYFSFKDQLLLSLT